VTDIPFVHPAGGVEDDPGQMDYVYLGVKRRTFKAAPGYRFEPPPGSAGRQGHAALSYAEQPDKLTEKPITEFNRRIDMGMGVLPDSVGH